MTSSTYGSGARNLIASAAVLISVLAALAVLVPASAFAAGTVHVDASAAAGGNGTSGSPYQTIQAGINGASAGDTIEVAAGTYTENVNVNKSVTISGDTGAKLVVTAATVNGIEVNANDVTIQGLDIEGPADQSYLTYAWGSVVTRGIFVHTGFTNFAITHNTVANLRNDILVDGRNTGSITSNVIDNSKSGISVQYTDGTAYDQTVPNATPVIVITGNTEGTYGNDWGINYHLNGHWNGVSGDQLHPVANIAGGGSSIAPTPSPAQQAALLANSAANAHWTIQDQAYTTSNRTDVTVATTGTLTAQGDPLGPISTLQAGVDAVVVGGGKVHVNAGTYTGSVTITKNGLSLLGTAGVTVNESATDSFGYPVTVDNASGITVSGISFNGAALPANTYALHAYHADGLTLKNLSFTGPGRTSTHVGGIDVNTSSSVTFDTVSSTGFYKNGISVTSSYVAADPASSNITFNNVTSTDNGWSGLSFYTIGNDHSPTSIGGHNSITSVSFTGTNTLGGSTLVGLHIEGDSDANEGAAATPAYTVTTDGTTLDLSHVAFVASGIYDIDNYQTAPVNALATTFDGMTGTAMTQSQRNFEDAKIVDQLDHAAYGLVTYYTPAPTTVTVTIDAYVNGAQADNSTTAGDAFPMHAIFPGGEGDYTLSPTGFNNPDAYKATTSDLPVGSNYSTYQTDAADANKCTAAYPFRLVGYGTGATLEDAAAAPVSHTVPSFTNLQSNQFVVAQFKTCPPAPDAVTPMTSGTTVTNAELPKIDWTDVSDSLGPVASYNYEVSMSPDTGAFGSFSNVIYSASLPTSENPNGGTPDGTYYWHEQAVDAAGHPGPWTAPMYITFHSVPADTQPPVVTVTPTATTLHGMATFTITVTDNNPLDPSKNGSVFVYLYNDAPPQAHDGGYNVDLSGGTGTFTVDTTHLADGAATLDVGVVYDAAGNATTDGNHPALDSYFSGYTIDNAPAAPSGPSVPMNGAPNATTLNTNEFDFTWDASTGGTAPLTYEFQSTQDPTEVDGVLTNNLWQSGTLSTNSIHSSGAGDGVWYWQVRAIDADSNASDWSTIWNVTLDTAHHAPVAAVTTNAATNVTTNDATLNGTNGPTNASGHSFWVSTSPFDTSSPSIPANVYSTPDFGSISANQTFSATLSSLTATNGAVVSGGVQGTMPAVTPNTTYYFTAWANVGGTWVPGAQLSFTTGASEVVHTAPVANNQNKMVNENTSDNAITLTATASGANPLTYSIVTPPSHGVLGGSGQNVTYTPAENYTGPDSFTFKANDGTMDSNVATVSITVNVVEHENTAPVADDQDVTVTQDTPAAITLTGSDADEDALTFATTSSPTNGTLSGTGADLTYTPNAGYTGPDSFTYVANDGTTDSAPATVTITVNANGAIGVGSSGTGGSGSGSTNRNSRTNGSSGSTGTTDNGGQVLGAAAFNFTRDLHLGLSGDDVKELQTELIAAGYSIPAGATGYFGTQTQAAVILWQTQNNIFPAAGYFGPISRAKYANDGGFPALKP